MNPQNSEQYLHLWIDQFRRWENLCTVFETNMQNKHNEFDYLTSFLAFTAANPGMKETDQAKYFVEKVVALLSTQASTMNHPTRESLMNAVSQLNKRGFLQLIEVIPIWFSIIGTKDKALRLIAYQHLCRDIRNLNRQTKADSAHSPIRDYIVSQLAGDDIQKGRKALACLIEMHRGNVWKDSKTVNSIAGGLFKSDLKTVKSACAYLLGNKMAAEEVLDDEENQIDRIQTIAKALVMGKETRIQKKSRKFKKAKELAKKQLERLDKKRQNIRLDEKTSIAHIDLLYNPLELCEKVYKLVNGKETYSDAKKINFKTKVALIRLIARLIARHRLIFLAFYSFIVQFIGPKQLNINEILACLIEGTHGDVPPTELYPIKKVLLEKFVIETVADEIQTVGLNTCVELARRNINFFTSEDLEDITFFFKSKSKPVRAAAKSIVNYYRVHFPKMLPAKLRGKAGAIAVINGEDDRIEFGEFEGSSSIPGLRFLLMKERRTLEVCEEDVQKEMEDRVFTNKDYSEMQKLYDSVEIARANGVGVSTAKLLGISNGDDEEMDTDSESVARSETDSDEESSEGEANFESVRERRTVVAEAVDADALKKGIKDGVDIIRMTPQQRKSYLKSEKTREATQKEGWKNNKKEERTESWGASHSGGKKSLPQSVQRRNKNMMMVKQKREVREKPMLSIRDKLRKNNKDKKSQQRKYRNHRRG
eukprot:GHVH01006513.1.p1 GENE.GHVH01006513.1~~GHVH01006513.1.p1  ORF type:complete len:795 (+),score=161.83 GHVH01006513.1:262-2385(+)